MEEKPKSVRSVGWPGWQALLKRLCLIAAVLLPVTWLCYALAIESFGVMRHFLDWMRIWGGAVALVFLLSMLPGWGAARRFRHWLFTPRILRRVVVAMIWIGTAIVFFYVEEDWRGSRAWNSYRREAEAQGAQLDYAAFVPKPVPEGENFAANPVVEAWFKRADIRHANDEEGQFHYYWQDSYEVIAGHAAIDNTKRHLTDLSNWAENFRIYANGQTNGLVRLGDGKMDMASRAAAAAAVLAGLETNRAALAELAAASKRPLCRYPVDYDLENPFATLLPHLRDVRGACLRLQLRACAELALGRSDDALADVKLTMYLADSLNGEPTLISQLVRIAGLRMAADVVWEGLAEHAWTDAQLQELQARFEKYDFLADMKHAMDSERAADAGLGELIRKKGMGVFIEILGPGQPTQWDKRVADIAGEIIPSGWIYQEELTCCRLFDVSTGGVMDTERKTVSPKRMASNDAEVTRELLGGGFPGFGGAVWKHRLLASVLLPALDKTIKKAAGAQAEASQVTIACALERFRLAKGSFPETLDALAPKFISQLPNDVINGGPMKYRRTDDGQFVLYSVGWNEKDDGGTPGKKLFDDEGGDWVWEYPKL